MKSRSSDAPPVASARRSVRKTWSTESSDQTSATCCAAPAKPPGCAARMVPLIAPADAPAMISKGCVRSRSAGIWAMRFSTPAW